MQQSKELAARFDAYADWRRRLSSSVSALHDWLSEQDLADAQTDVKVQRLLERLHQDKLVVAFVAEFSRGKSELINAIFFADFGQRLLPSSAGRTTMCPTELLYDATRPPSLRLLPIETRARDGTVAELKNYADEWVTMGLDLSAPDKMAEVLSQLARTKRVPLELARRYGLYEDGDTLGPVAGAQDAADIPCWRHAVINFPHPLLQQGLVILDTPGLNAIGTEPELTLNLLPNAHAVLFILSADAGVTKTDIDVWQNHLAGEDPATKAGRMVILNKIDGLWDELRGEAEVEAEITKQVQTTADFLAIPTSSVFPVSAQKALVAKVNGDDALLAKSRLRELEQALSGNLIPAKRHIVGAAAQAELQALAASARLLLSSRLASVHEQLGELRGLRGKNHDVIEHMMDRVQQEKLSFERGMQRYTALRTVFTQQTNDLYECIGLERLRATATDTRERIERSPFTKGVRVAMNDFFASIYGSIDQSAAKTTEIHDMMLAMYGRFAKEHGLQPFSPPPFSMLKYQKEVERLERAYNVHFNTLWNMVSKAKFTLMKRFFETIATRVKHVYDIANRDVESWLKAVMSPLESQVREHHLQLRRRLESVKRIHRASDELEERIVELEQAQKALEAQKQTLASEIASVEALIVQDEVTPLAANG